MNEKVIIAYRIKRKLLRLFLFAAALFVLSFAVLFLWNSILPPIIHVNTISYWQAISLLFLCRLLFGNLSFGNWWAGVNKESQPESFKEKLMNMNDVDRAAFKAEWRKRREWKKG